MRKTLIVTSFVDHIEHVRLPFDTFDIIICADGGLLNARHLGLKPDFLIGDYDSMEQPSDEVIKLPTEKDMTDSEAAIDLAVAEGATHITVLGGLGGRFDHTMGNVGMLAKYCGKLSHLAFTDGQNYIFMLPPGSYTLPKNSFTYLGIVSYGSCAENVTLRGVKYPLTDYLLTDNTTLGVSNEITEDVASVSFTSGRLLIIFSSDLSSSSGEKTAMAED